MRRTVSYEIAAQSDWSIDRNPDGKYPYDQVALVLLMDIRAELRKINATLRCEETQDIPRLLRAIRRNTSKPRLPGRRGRLRGGRASAKSRPSRKAPGR
jgi:hypothetical protein